MGEHAAPPLAAPLSLDFLLALAELPLSCGHSRATDEGEEAARSKRKLAKAHLAVRSLILLALLQLAAAAAAVAAAAAGSHIAVVLAQNAAERLSHRATHSQSANRGE